MSDPAVAAPVNENLADDAMKVFAGNLAFATTEDQLRDLFTEAGKVVQAQIIKRGTRSLGYGFVTYETESEAQKAIQILNKKELSGREINVESAKPQADLAKHNDSGNVVAEGEEGEGFRGGRGRGRGRARRGRGGRGGATARRPRADDGEEGLEDPIKENGADSTPAANGEGGITKSARRRQKKAAARQAEANGEAVEATSTPAAAATTEKKIKTPREPRKPKGPPRGEPSKTLLFVANLPFAFSDEQLKAAFDGFKVKTATVVKRRFGTRTKGFGFVDLENEEEQQRALKEVHGKQVDGRDLQLKVAIQGDDTKETEAAAPIAA